jgi:hypothetical protein
MLPNCTALYHHLRLLVRPLQAVKALSQFGLAMWRQPEEPSEAQFRNELPRYPRADKGGQNNERK